MDAARVSRPSGDRVRVWLIRLTPPPPDARLPWLVGLLDDDEIGRARAMRRASDRFRFVTVHAAARLILAEHLAVEPAQIRWERGPHGKPHLVGAGAGTHANLSDSGDLAALAVADRPVGIDVQALTFATDAAAMSRRYFPDGEARYVAAPRSAAARLGRFVRLWTRKEACVKAAGARLMQGMKLPVRPPAGAARSGAVLVRDPGGPLPGPYLVRDVPAPAGYRAAVAVDGEAWYAVSRRQWVMPAAVR
jgi:4'-phosphopantetheinyl transferase